MGKDLLFYLKEALTEKKFLGIDNDICKRVILGYVLENGYVKGSYGYHNNNYSTYRGSPTVLEITRLLDEGDYEGVMASEDVLARMDAYVSGLVPEGQYAEYTRKAKEAWERVPHIDKKDMSLLCSLCNGFSRQLDYEKRQIERQRGKEAHQRKVDSPSNRWAGEVGQEVRFVVKSAEVTDTIDTGNYYGGSYPLWTIKDEEGLTYT